MNQHKLDALAKKAYIGRAKARQSQTRPGMVKRYLDHAQSLYRDEGATLDDLGEAVTTLEETERTARRVLGSSHPLVGPIERDLQNARAALRAGEETPSVGA